MSNAQLADTVPWYKQMWPWILISIPASAVVAGFVMLWMALNSQHSMVVDDYFKYGKTINKRIERDVAAARLGLSASLTRLPRELVLTLTSATSTAQAWPGAPASASCPPSDARLDEVVELGRQSNGTYRGGVSFPPGRWQIHVEPPSKQWRLGQPDGRDRGGNSREY